MGGLRPVTYIETDLNYPVLRPGRSVLTQADDHVTYIETG